jgi:hypothetical protein
VTRRNRDAIRRTHRPTGEERACAVHDEAWPCDAIGLLNELEEVEAAARTHIEQVVVLRGLVEELEDKIRRGIRKLTS